MTKDYMSTWAHIKSISISYLVRKALRHCKWHFFICNPHIDPTITLVIVLKDIHWPSHMVRDPYIYNLTTCLLWLWRKVWLILLVYAITVIKMFGFWLSNSVDTLVWLRSCHSISICSVKKLNPTTLPKFDSTIRVDLDCLHCFASF